MKYKYIHLQIVVDIVVWLLSDYSGYCDNTVIIVCLPYTTQYRLSTLTMLPEYLLTSIT